MVQMQLLMEAYHTIIGILCLRIMFVGMLGDVRLFIMGLMHIQLLNIIRVYIIICILLFSFNTIILLGIYVIVIILLNLWKNIKSNIRNLGLRNVLQKQNVCGHIIIIYYGCIMEVFLI